MKMKPDNREVTTLMSLFNRQHYDEAEFLSQNMTKDFPHFGYGWMVWGAALNQLGRSADALIALKKAKMMMPDDEDVHYNLAVTLQNLGRLDEAVVGYRRALQIKPHFVEANNGLGNTLRELGHEAEAEASYRLALKIKPDFIEALNNLAALLNAKGEQAEALKLTIHSMQVEESAAAKSLFVTCINRMHISEYNYELSAIMARALTEPWGRPADLVRASIRLIKLSPEIGECVARAAKAWPVRLSAQDLFGANGLAALQADALLRALLQSEPLCDIDMERFLTMARFAMLEAAVSSKQHDADTIHIHESACSSRLTHLISYSIGKGEVESHRGIHGNAAILSFCCALARQCFINEYVYARTDEEFRKACNLRDSMVAALEAHARIPVLWSIVVATYFPLCSLPFATRLTKMQWPEEVAAVIVQQVQEPAEEQLICDTIPCLTDIEDEVSLLVQNQYEENPYPRWIKADPVTQTINIAEYLHQKFPLASFRNTGKQVNINILVAGCGTGLHSIATAKRIRGAKVLAIDLSISSLAYATRKTRELELSSIEYAQADLLKLDMINRSFDVIESVGVLHHLADPWGGWLKLLPLLRPGGFMELGLYSAAARRKISLIWEFIAKKNYASSADGIRLFRQDLMDSDGDFETALNSADFFSTSTCRDLFFHVQEHRMTLTDIDAFLRKNKLKFLGFEIDADVLHVYRLRFPDDRSATNLVQWQIFENENPDTFSAMYQFWVQKQD